MRGVARVKTEAKGERKVTEKECVCNMFGNELTTSPTCTPRIAERNH